MGKGSGKINWSQERWKRHLIGPRKFLWPEDTVAKLAAWMGLKPGMIVIDAGCGLGYLGYTYWPYFGEGGRYFGVDASAELLRETAAGAKKWARKGKAFFVAGDALQLPFPDNFADCVMCQTLLIHQKEPELAMAGMVRVAKPGGLILCIEPDNISSMLAKRHSSLPEPGIETEVLLRKVVLITNKGRMKLGRGDFGVGNRVPMMMEKLGLTEIDARNQDQVNLLLPPYEGAVQQHRLETMKLYMGFDRDRKERAYWRKRQKEEFLAGGGDLSEFKRYWRIRNRMRRICERQIEDGKYFHCGAMNIYVVKGRKPAWFKSG
jgi:ubiquinone/menaquinone biosynthesis C-methylase UbiE